MEKLKLALVGCGKLNEIVAQAATDGVLASDYELVAVLEGHDKERGRKFGERYHIRRRQLRSKLSKIMRKQS